MRLRYINYATMAKEQTKDGDEAEALAILERELGFTEGSFLVIDFGAQNALQFIVTKTGDTIAEIVVNNGNDMTIWAKPASDKECKALIAELYRTGEITDVTGFSRTDM